MKNAEIKHVHFTENHYDHFNWVKDNKKIVKKIDEWINYL